MDAVDYVIASRSPEDSAAALGLVKLLEECLPRRANPLAESNISVAAARVTVQQLSLGGCQMATRSASSN
jgi:hypothetical protein